MTARTLRHVLLTFSLALAALAPIAAPARADVIDFRLLMPMKARPLVPGFILPEARSEQPFRIKGMRGRVVVVNFWWTGCPSCLAEMPSLDRLWNSLRNEGVIVLAVHVGGRLGVIRRYLKRVPVSFPVLWDSGKLVSRQWGVYTTPTTMIVGPSGRLEYIAFGGRVWDNPEIRRAILQLRTRP